MEFKWTNQTRVTEARDSQSLARALRSGCVGQFMVERFGGRYAPCWHQVSSHASMEAAEKAKAKLDHKIAKESK
jgi:hypothetical protein